MAEPLLPSNMNSEQSLISLIIAASLFAAFSACCTVVWCLSRRTPSAFANEEPYHPLSSPEGSSRESDLASSNGATPSTSISSYPTPQTPQTPSSGSPTTYYLRFRGTTPSATAADTYNQHTV